MLMFLCAHIMYAHVMYAHIMCAHSCCGGCHLFLSAQQEAVVCLDVESHVYNTRVVCVHACLVHCIHGGNSLHHQSYGGHAPLQTYFETFRLPIRRRQSQ